MSRIRIGLLILIVGFGGLLSVRLLGSGPKSSEAFSQSPPAPAATEFDEDDQGENHDDEIIPEGDPLLQAMTFGKYSNEDSPQGSCEFDKGFWIPRTIGTSSTDQADTGVKGKFQLDTLHAPTIGTKGCLYRSWQTLGVHSTTNTTFVEVRLENTPDRPEGPYRITFDDEHGHNATTIYYQSWPSLTPTVKLIAEHTCSGALTTNGLWSACVDWNGDGIFEVNVGTIGSVGFSSGEIWSEVASGGEPGLIRPSDGRNSLQYQTASTSWRDWPGTECPGGIVDGYYFHKALATNAYTINTSSSSAC